MDIVEAYKEAKKLSTYRIVNVTKTRLIDFNHERETLIKKYDELGSFLDVKIKSGCDDWYIGPLLADDWEVVEK